jgi:hypothetical protein
MDTTLLVALIAQTGNLVDVIVNIEMAGAPQCQTPQLVLSALPLDRTFFGVFDLLPTLCVRMAAPTTELQAPGHDPTRLLCSVADQRTLKPAVTQTAEPRRTVRSREQK